MSISFKNITTGLFAAASLTGCVETDNAPTREEMVHQTCQRINGTSSRTITFPHRYVTFAQESDDNGNIISCHFKEVTTPGITRQSGIVNASNVESYTGTEGEARYFRELYTKFCEGAPDLDICKTNTHLSF